MLLFYSEEEAREQKAQAESAFAARFLEEFPKAAPLSGEVAGVCWRANGFDHHAILTTRLDTHEAYPSGKVLLLFTIVVNPLWAVDEVRIQMRTPGVRRILGGKGQVKFAIEPHLEMDLVAEEIPQGGAWLAEWAEFQRSRLDFGPPPPFGLLAGDQDFTALYRSWRCCEKLESPRARQVRSEARALQLGLPPVALRLGELVDSTWYGTFLSGDALGYLPREQVNLPTCLVFKTLVLFYLDGGGHPLWPFPEAPLQKVETAPEKLACALPSQLGLLPHGVVQALFQRLYEWAQQNGLPRSITVVSPGGGCLWRAWIGERIDWAWIARHIQRELAEHGHRRGRRWLELAHGLPHESIGICQSDQQPLEEASRQRPRTP